MPLHHCEACGTACNTKEGGFREPKIATDDNDGEGDNENEGDELLRTRLKRMTITTR